MNFDRPVLQALRFCMITDENQFPMSCSSFTGSCSDATYGRALVFYFISFSCPEPVTTSLENALVYFPSQCINGGARQCRGSRQRPILSKPECNRHLRGTGRNWRCFAGAQPIRDFTAVQPRFRPCSLQVRSVMASFTLIFARSYPKCLQLFLDQVLDKIIL